MLVSNYNRNLNGTDYFVGDIHGEYSKLMDGLCKIGFNYNTDRLFSVGDIVDRGDDSLKCLTLLEEPWFYCIKGNHEQMMLDAILKDWSDDPATGKVAYQLWFQNGGDWGESLSEEEDKLLSKLLHKVNALPNAITVGDVGVVHAECPLNDWDLLCYDSGNYLREKAMWSRTRLSRRQNNKVRGVGAIVVGHSPVKEVTVLGNHVYIDSGAVFNGKNLFILSYDEVLRLVE